MPDKQRDDDARNQEQDHVRFTHVAAGESPWPLHLADEERGDHASQHEEREDVYEQRVPTLVAEPRQRGVLVDNADHRDEDRREQHDEAPEDGRVHEARPQPLEELALPDHNHGLGLGAPGQVVESRDRLAHADEPVYEQRAARKQHDRDGQHDAESRCGDRVHFSLRISAEMAGTISFRSPTTA